MAHTSQDRTCPIERELMPRTAVLFVNTARSGSIGITGSRAIHLRKMHVTMARVGPNKLCIVRFVAFMLVRHASTANHRVVSTQNVQPDLAALHRQPMDSLVVQPTLARDLPRRRPTRRNVGWVPTHHSYPSKALWHARLLQRHIHRHPRSASMIDHEVALGDGAAPSLMIALARPDPMAAMLLSGAVKSR